MTLWSSILDKLHRSSDDIEPDPRYNEHDEYIEELRRSRQDLRKIRKILAGPTGNFIEDMMTGGYEGDRR